MIGVEQTTWATEKRSFEMSGTDSASEAPRLGDGDEARDYERVERALSFLDEHFREQPTLAATAAHVGVSPFHFHRLFQRWAGITPKRFLEYTTAGFARRLLEGSMNVLDASFEAGLSGPSRLHDLFVTLEGVTPGQVRDGGLGLEIRYGYHPSPFGECFLAETDRGVCALSFVDPEARDQALHELAERWPAAALRVEERTTRATLERILGGLKGDRRSELKILAQGTNFQVRVWEALLNIPPAKLATYDWVAHKIGRPTASRAVGQAIAANPVVLAIPCHRVIRKTGGFGHYSGGAVRKRVIIGWEASGSERPVRAADAR